jgi:hypothetical protein
MHGQEPIHPAERNQTAFQTEKPRSRRRLFHATHKSLRPFLTSFGNPYNKIVDIMLFSLSKEVFETRVDKVLVFGLEPVSTPLD